MRIRRSLAAIAAAAAAGLVATLGALPASASPSPVFPGNGAGLQSAYGFDGNANLAAGGGSDTTYLVIQNLSNLWNLAQDNGAALCSTNKSPHAFTPGSAYPPSDSSSTAAIAQCSPATQTFAPSNYDADVIVDGPVAGSGAGIASLNGDNGGTSGVYPYEGVNSNVGTSDTGGFSNGFGVPDFARSSRAPAINKGNCDKTGVTGTNIGSNVNDELACDTFWGYAEDGVQMTVFNSTAALSPTISLSATQIDGIYNCTITDWNQIDSRIPAGTPIVPWAMNSNSGTYGTFNSYIQTAASDSAFKADNNVPFSSSAPLSGNGAISTSKGCVRELGNESGVTGFNGQAGVLSGNGLNPLENDIKGFVNDANNFPDTRPVSAGGGATFGLSTSATSTQNPANWIWFSSFGVLSTFPFTSAEAHPIPGSNSTIDVSSAPTNITVGASSIGPSGSNIFLNKYPINRTLFHVTRKSDADCPLNPNIAITASLNTKVCDFTTNTGATTPYCNATTNPNGGSELNVITNLDSFTVSTTSGGLACTAYTQTATTGSSGAVREFTRWLCRSSTDATGTNPFNGDSWSTDIASGIHSAGFQLVPTTLRSPGSSCSVFSRG